MTSQTCDSTDSGSQTSLRQSLLAATCVVVKVGTNVLLDDQGALIPSVLAELSASIARLRQAGRDVVLISSGAIAAGAHRLGLDYRQQRGACAAAGQSLLTTAYQHQLGQHGHQIAQILVTSDDFLDPVRAGGLGDTIRQLLQLGIIPLINENDAVSHHVSTAATRLFQDNDQLAALITRLLAVRSLILLTNVDGLYTLDPAHHQAELISELNAVTDEHLDNAVLVGPRGRGGMKAKLLAVEQALEEPALVAVIANGRRPGILDQIFAGAAVGTVIARREPGRSSMFGESRAIIPS